MNFGVGPDANTAEVTIFGPGYGECIVLHLGCGQWAIIDSCIDKATGQSVARTYLEAIGVPKGDVRHLVISHWHDDHVQGMLGLVEHYSDAQVWMS